MVNSLYPLTGISLFFISVSSNKNKTGFWYFSTVSNKESDISGTENSRLSDVSDDFLFWFSGFTDALYHDMIMLSTAILKLNTRDKKNTKNFLKDRENTNTELVIWGSNLQSTIGEGRFTKVVRDMIRLPALQFSILVGLLLSDGWLSIATSTSLNARLGFKQSLAKSEYLLFVFNLLSHYCSNLPALVKGKKLGIAFYGVQFFTRSLPCFTELYNLFYVNKKKLIPAGIYNMLTPVALAHWIMGDGVFYKNKGITLCTDSYSVQDTVRLMNVLMIRYDLKCSLHLHREGQYRIYISSKSMESLTRIVKPYMTPCMFYKLGL